jgi:hypothetical protein
MLRGVNDELELLASRYRGRPDEDVSPSGSYTGLQQP